LALTYRLALGHPVPPLRRLKDKAKKERALLFRALFFDPMRKTGKILISVYFIGVGDWLTGEFAQFASFSSPSKEGCL